MFGSMSLCPSASVSVKVQAPMALSASQAFSLPKASKPAFVAAAAAEAGNGIFGKIEPYSGKYFGVCAVGGILSCGLTHTVITPLDLVKCNMQANPAKYTGMIQGFGVFLKEGSTLTRGWAPTLVGYSLQGLHKFGLYEYFKHTYGNMVSAETKENYTGLLYMASSASAEFFADIALCPWEAVKVRVQTDPTFANGLTDGLPKIIAQEGVGGLFKGLVPLWARQIPYTIIKFVAFEKVVRAIYATLPGEQADYGYWEQLGVTFLAGYIAGVFCAIVSHPADTMVSKLNSAGDGEGVASIYNKIGFSGLWGGLGPRIIMIGTLTGLQWFIYDSFKVTAGLAASGGSGKKTEEKK